MPESTEVEHMVKAMEFITRAINDEDFSMTITAREAASLVDGMLYHFLFLLDLTANFNNMSRGEAFDAYADVYRALLLNELDS